MSLLVLIVGAYVCNRVVIIDVIYLVYGWEGNECQQQPNKRFCSRVETLCFINFLCFYSVTGTILNKFYLSDTFKKYNEWLHFLININIVKQI